MTSALAGHDILGTATRGLLVAALAAMVVALLLAAAASGRRGRRLMRLPTRVRLRLHPGPGFAHRRWALWRRHGLPSARRSARRTRPALSRRERLLGSWQQYATFIGWAHGWIVPVRVYAGFEQLVLVIAPPQKGKSAAAAGRIIDDPGPVVATSIRGDLIAATAGLRQQVGEVHVFNPEAAGPYRSTFRWDPVAGCQDMATATRRAGYMVEAMTARGLEDSTFWSDQASMILAALMHAAALAGGTMRNVYRWILEDDSSPLRILSGHPEAAETAAHHVNHYLALPDRTRSGISSTLVAVLRFMQVPEVAAVVCPGPGQGLDFAAFLRSRDTLYLVASDAAQSPVPPLFAALIAELAHQARITGATGSGAVSRGVSRLDPPLTLELDEVGNIAPIPVAAWATWAAGSGIRIHIYAQAFAQLAERWGPLGAETIWQACDIKVIYAGSSEESLCRKVEDACGQVQVRGRATGAREAAAAPWETRQILPFADIRELPAGRAVVIRAGVAPVIVRTEQYWRRRDVHRSSRRGGRPILPVTSARQIAAPMPELMAAVALQDAAHPRDDLATYRATRPRGADASAPDPTGPWTADVYPQLPVPQWRPAVDGRHDGPV